MCLCCLLKKSLKVIDSKQSKSFEEALNDSVSYLSKLKGRLQDKQSRIMITGDLNAGKSTLINALIGRSLLPTDQQPCTQAFCEVVPLPEPSKEIQILGFSGEEEQGISLSLDEMKAELQREDSPFGWFKLFANVPVDFLHSQVSISLIDSPGLNTDQIKTTHLFSQQQDIDVIVFVINAAFHLTLSGRQFLQQAAKERQKIFFIVNKFDEIVNAEKCKNQILKQISEVMPEMNPADMTDLIHFVSAKSVIGSEDSEPAKQVESPIESSEINLNVEEDQPKQEEIDFQAPFDQMKHALIDFVFLKRSVSKLAPVKTYTTRLLQDLLELSAFNIRLLTAENRGITTKLDQIKPLLHQKESSQPRLQCQLNDISENASERTKESTLASASSFHARLLKMIQNRPFGHILKGSLFVGSVFAEASREYAEFCQAVHQLTDTARATGIEEMTAISQEHSIEVESVDTRFIFSLPPQLPLKQPSFFDLFDPRSVLEHFGILNLTSLVSGIVAYQPLWNICYRLAGRLGINPFVLGVAAIGGIGKRGVVIEFLNHFLGFYLSHLASSSVERSIRSRLIALFSARFNLEGWAADLSDRASQAVFVYLTARGSRIVSAYAAEVEKSRRESSTLQGQSEQLGDQILFLKDLSRRIESLIGQVQTINL